MKPEIIILMPVYNGMPFIPESIESVLGQSLSNWRLLISDNCSQDATREFLKRLIAKGDYRIQVSFQPENLGIFGNLNYLFDKAESGIPIHILCADDIFSHRHALAEIVKYFAGHAHSPDVVRWNGASLQAAGVPKTLSGRKALLYFFLLGNIMGSLSCVSCRSDPRKIAGAFDQTYPFVGDYEFWCRLAASGGYLAIEPQDLVGVRSHPGQASYYLSQKGEQYMQQSRVKSRLYCILVIDLDTYARLMLRLVGTLTSDSRYRLSALLSAMAGKPEALDSLNAASEESSYVIVSPCRELIWLISMGGKVWKKFAIGLALRACTSKISA